MVVRKILETTLTAGSTTVTFTDADIPNSLIRTYCTDSDLYPISLSLTGTVLTITYEAQSSNVGVALEIVKEGLQVIDNLTSTDTNNALSANQGKVLKDTIDGLTAPALTELSDVDFTSITDGDIIVYDSVSEKFVNQSMPSIPSSITDLDDVVLTSPTDGQVLTYQNGEIVNTSIQTGGANYLTTEHICGTWIDGSDLYEKTTAIGAIAANTSNYQLTVGLTNVDRVISIQAVVRTSNSYFNLPLSMLQSGSTYSEYGINMQAYDKTTDKLRFDTGSQRTINDGYVTIRYTKTT